MAPFDVPTQTYILPPDLSAGDVLERLTKSLSTVNRGRPNPALEAVAGPQQVATWCVLDTADQRLRAAGLDLGLESAHGQLVLRGTRGSRVVGQRSGRAPRRWLAADLPVALRQRLAPVVGIRALLPVVVVRRREQPVEVHDRDAKTVVRLTLTDLWASPETDPVRLPSRVEVAGVLGYPKAFARVDRLLQRMDLDPTDVPVVDHALVADGRDPQPPRSRRSPELRPKDPGRAATQRVLAQLAEVVEANLAGTLDDLDTEFLHDLRVAVRRSRSVLREMKKVFEPQARRAQADALRWVQAVTGPTRDLDVQLLEWDELVAHLPAESRADVGVAHEVLTERRTDAFRAMRATLRSAGYQQRWGSWRAFVAEPPAPADDRAGQRAIRRLAGRRIRSVYRAMVRDGSAIDQSSPPEALHDLRKRGKELRYLLELFGGVLPASKVKPLVASLKGLQDVLGRHQDREVQAESLRALGPEVAARPGGADALMALGALVDRLRTEQGEARDQFVDRFTAFAGLPVPK
ncbi:MAG: CHAD domain-containing protein [Acidimicrobiales bacterium]